MQSNSQGQFYFAAQHSGQHATASTPQAQSPAPPIQNLPSMSGPTRTTRRGGSNLKGIFAKDLKSLMYGFSDEPIPASDSVSVMEEILIEYLANVTTTALAPTKKTRLQIEDLRRVLTRPPDAKKLARMEELLFMQEDIKRARQQFEEEGAH